jgi:2-isopropylmalate synthase
MLVQSKEELIERTFESIRGAPRAIVHLYNSTSPAQRRITFGIDKQGVIDIAVRGTKQIKDRVKTCRARKSASSIRRKASPPPRSISRWKFARRSAKRGARPRKTRSSSTCPTRSS